MFWLVFCGYVNRTQNCTWAIFAPKGKLRLRQNQLGEMEGTRFCRYWQFRRFQEFRASKSYAYAYVLLVWQLRDIRFRRNRQNQTTLTLLTQNCTWARFAPKGKWRLRQNQRGEIESTRFYRFSPFRRIQKFRASKS